MTDSRIAGSSPLPAAADRFAAARAVADATLYEGYLLYPYRASSTKNRLRWQFGVLAPRAWAETSSERWTATTECLAETDAATELHLRVRFLQLQRRTVEAETEGSYREVDSLDDGTARWVPWDEAVERLVDLPVLDVDGLGPAPSVLPFRFDAGTSHEPIRSADGAVIGRVRRAWGQLDGTVSVRATPAGGGTGLTRLTAAVRNTGPAPCAPATRDEVMPCSLIGVHTLLALDGGRFVSIIDPPPGAGGAAAGCHNEGTFPVLVADPHGGTDVVLSSPITLYDHPEIAPESQGDLYDATEIDEILALRVLTLTDGEKAEARGTDPRAAAIVDRCDRLDPDGWARLHGTMRDLERDGGTPNDATAQPWWDPGVDAEVDPWSDRIVIAGVEVGKGVKVVLRPNRRADAHDLFLDGMAATVAGVFHDVDGSDQVAVTVDGDPANEELSWQGRYLYFFPDEIEPRP